MKTLQDRRLFALLASFIIFNDCIARSAAQEQMSRSPSVRISQHHLKLSQFAERPRESRGTQTKVVSAPNRQASYSTEHEQIVAPGVNGQSLEPIPFERYAYDTDAAGGGPSDSSYACDQCGLTELCCCDYLGCLFDWSRAEFWLGLASFTGEGNYTTTGSSANGQIEGSFGFQQGFNFASRVPCFLRGQLGAQIGMRFVQTQLDGSAAGPDNRNQTFLTGGLFRRVDYGVQGGLVVDYSHNDWFYKADLLQLRGELSFLFSPCHDFGFRFTNSQQSENTVATVTGLTAPVPIELSALNTYRFFYRHRFGDCIRGLADWQVGWSENSAAILGAAVETPLHDQLGLRANATYLIPSSSVSDSYSGEAWNIGLALVWTPGRLFGSRRDYYRPLFDVADNGSMLSRISL